jgi:Tetracyclin repressor-like, C-terminal domain
VALQLGTGELGVLSPKVETVPRSRPSTPRSPRQRPAPTSGRRWSRNPWASTPRSLRERGGGSRRLDRALPSRAIATYTALASASRAVVQHVDALVAQLGRILGDGVEQREFAIADPIAAGRAGFDATSRFHNPAHAAEWSDPGIDVAFEGVWTLVLGGLR